MSVITDRDRFYMQHALGLAALGMNTTDPNPRVGCVLVRGDRIIGEGWHERAGEGHAEVRALESAGDAAGATAYVTLEPCAAQGRTGPCTEALIGARVQRVVFAAEDPNPRMQRGADRLRAAGIEVCAGVLATEARLLNPGFFKRHATGLPWVRLKLGMSLDARTALADGTSRWITGPAARKDVQLFRARSSAILTGVETVLADDPAMNVRLDGALRQPLRVVLDSRLRSPPSARIFSGEGASLVLTTSTDVGRREAIEAAQAQVQGVAGDADGRCDLRGVLRLLAARDANEVWVEAGPVLSGALLAAQLVDELVLYVAPALLGPDARPLAMLPPLSTLEQRSRWQFIECTKIGDDLRIIARPARS